MVSYHFLMNWNRYHNLAMEGSVEGSVDTCPNLHHTWLVSQTISIADRLHVLTFLSPLVPSFLVRRPGWGMMPQSLLTAFIFESLLELSWLEVDWSFRGSTLAFLISNSTWHAAWLSFYQELKLTLALLAVNRKPGRWPKLFLCGPSLEQPHQKSVP